MRKIVDAYTHSSIILRIVIGLVIGTLIGLLAPSGLEFVSILGTLFVGALKAIAPLLVFFLVINALCRAKAPASMKTVIILYIVSTLCAALVAVVASQLFPTTLTLSGVEAADQSSPEGIGEVLTTLLTNIVANPIDAIVNANYLGVLAWAIFLGVAIRSASDATKDIFGDISSAISKIVRWIIQFAPFGVLGLMYDAISENGIEIFVEYGHLLLVLVGSMLVIALIVNPLLVFITIRKNPYPLVLRCLRDSGITAFFTRSSAANIPVNMELSRAMGISKDTYSVSIPLGATINMAGASVTISVMSMATAYTLGISVDPVTAVILCVLAAVSACGASGVAGGSLLLIPLACSLFGISSDIAMQVVGIGFVIGVVQDSCETALNSSSDALFTATADYRERRAAGVDFTPGANAHEWRRRGVIVDGPAAAPADAAAPVESTEQIQAAQATPVALEGEKPNAKE